MLLFNKHFWVILKIAKNYFFSARVKFPLGDAILPRHIDAFRNNFRFKFNLRHVDALERHVRLIQRHVRHVVLDRRRDQLAVRVRHLRDVIITTLYY